MKYCPTPDGLIVQSPATSPIPVTEWTNNQITAAAAGVLIRLLNDERATQRNDYTILVPWPHVASLSVPDITLLGLPKHAPVTLEITGHQIITDHDFTVQYSLDQDGRRVARAERQGAWIKIADTPYILPTALFDLIDAIDSFRAKPPSNLTDRMCAWDRIARLAPPEAIDSEYLRSFRIAVASSFTLDPFINAQGEPDFHPIIGRQDSALTDTGEFTQTFANALRPTLNTTFTKKFHKLRVKSRYSLGSNTFVALTPELKQALRIAKNAQKGDAATRRDFLVRPTHYLNGALDAIDIETVFYDDDLSRRIEGIGIWTGKVLPWIAQPAEAWLPPPALGLRVGDQFMTVSPNDLPGILDWVKRAAADNQPSVRVENHDIPTTPDTITAIESLIRSTHPVHRPEDSGRGRTPRKDRHVLIVTDNLTTLDFRRRRSPRKPSIRNSAPRLNSKLFPHQEHALTWLLRHWNAGNSGCIVADDMGLGKTLEALAFLACWGQHIRGYRLQRRPILIVAPTGLLDNWQEEHEKHLARPGLGRILPVHGKQLRRLIITPGTNGRTQGNEMTRAKELTGLEDSKTDATTVNRDLARLLSILDINTIKRHDVVLTTYETLRDYQHSFARIAWGVAIYDEAQKIKNPGTLMTTAALAMNSAFTVMMTGTPVENRVADIWSLLEMAEPASFGTLRDFSKSYEIATPENAPADALSTLHRKLTRPTETAPAIMLRRLKEQHIPNLPEKHHHTRIVTMPSVQADRYREIVEGAHSGSHVLRTLQHLQNASLHPYHPTDEDINTYIAQSARLTETIQILDTIRVANEKALVFLESREMQAFLLRALRQRYRLPTDVLLINGTIASRARQDRVRTFQQRPGFDVMILSPRAGGVGLTLTAANHVIHLSRWWNPAVEDQCTDRVYRIGQDRPVHAYYPIAKHPSYGDYSFDLRLDALIARKRSLNHKILAPTIITSHDHATLFRSTVSDAKARLTSEGSALPNKCDLHRIDLMEPDTFEQWVLGELVMAGYDPRRTPRSNDKGADGVGFFPDPANRHTLLIQCKHLAPDRACRHNAVDEVIRAVDYYRKPDNGPIQTLVVTTAKRFTKRATDLAATHQVHLIHRAQLHTLRDWRPTATG